MKRLALVAAVLAVAACATKEETPAVDTAAPPAMAPAPAVDSAAKDTTMNMDSANKDTTAKKP